MGVKHQVAESKGNRLRGGDAMNIGDIFVDGRKYASSMNGFHGAVEKPLTSKEATLNCLLTTINPLEMRT